MHLQRRTCDCGHFDALRFPCAHAIAACAQVRLDHMRFINDVYRLQNMYTVWNHEFPPVPDEKMWPSISSTPFRLAPNVSLRRKPKGRPKSSRIRNEMDDREWNDHIQLCGYCRNSGHTRTSCPHLAEELRPRRR